MKKHIMRDRKILYFATLEDALAFTEWIIEYNQQKYYIRLVEWILN